MKRKPASDQGRHAHMQLIENFLTHDEKKELEALRDRIRAILFLNDGWKLEQVGKALFLDQDTIERYYKMYQKRR